MIHNKISEKLHPRVMGSAHPEVLGSAQPGGTYDIYIVIPRNFSFRKHKYTIIPMKSSSKRYRCNIVLGRCSIISGDARPGDTYTHNTYTV